MLVRIDEICTENFGTRETKQFGTDDQIIYVTLSAPRIPSAPILDPFNEVFPALSD